MKVTFTGTYTEVIRNLNVPEITTSEETQRKNFSKLLGDLEGVTTQVPDKSRNPDSPAFPINPLVDEVMASLNPSTYNTTIPLENELIIQSGVKEPTEKPSKPSIFSASRVEPLNSSFKTPPHEIASLIDRTGLQEGVDPLLALSVAKSESSFNPNAVSSDGHASKGLFQLLDSTGKHLHSKLDVNDKYDPFNPTLNTKLGVNYLRYLHDIFSKETSLPNNLKTSPAENSIDLEKFAVAAFNAGEGRVASAQSRAAKSGANPSKFDEVNQFLPSTTQEYVARVIRYRDQFENNS
jgi:hypothetical protein